MSSQEPDGYSNGYGYGDSALPDYVEDALYDVFSQVTISLQKARLSDNSEVDVFVCKSRAGVMRAQENVAVE